MHPFPTFRYHPDPIASGSILVSSNVCGCCGLARGYAYAGPVYGEAGCPEALCPWCIADGSAHAQSGVTFVDSEALDGEATETERATLVTRTPGFCAWQGGRWLSCCGGPAAFLAPVGHAEIRSAFPRLEAALMGCIVHGHGVAGGAAIRMLESLQRDQPPTAYLFRCLTCESMPVYIDAL